LKPIGFASMAARTKSPPAWGRGLKRNIRGDTKDEVRVAPRVGAWIETLDEDPPIVELRRPPRGGVD